MKELILYALRRFCMLIPFLIGLTLVAFLLGVLSPGDPALALLTMDGTSEPTAEELDALRHAMGLDQPVWIQYGRWLMNALHGDLGVSYLTQKPVLDEILRRFPITFHLAVWAIGWVLVIGIPAGLGFRKGADVVDGQRDHPIAEPGGFAGGEREFHFRSQQAEGANGLHQLPFIH